MICLDPFGGYYKVFLNSHIEGKIQGSDDKYHEAYVHYDRNGRLDSTDANSTHRL
jgi:hypothetical protein